MKIVIDDKIPYIRGVFEPVAEVVYFPGHKINRNLLKDCDALIIRTRTVCNEELLAGTDVKFIATATIGYDHIDVEWCNQAGISWTNAPGCNAGSVEQYIASALVTWSIIRKRPLRGTSVGIVGVGNVGKRVEKLCRIMGMELLLNDPPRERAEGAGRFTSLADISRKAEIITFHVPLYLEGIDATWHLVNREFLGHCQCQPLLINTCRGEVFDSEAVMDSLKQKRISDLIIDCWEGEPDINPELMKECLIATPHIAGYSRDGKANGTMMSVRALSRFFGLDLNEWKPGVIEPPDRSVISLDGTDREEEEVLGEAILATYDVLNDDRRLRSNPSLFEKLRGNYQVRREFGAFTLEVTNLTRENISKFEMLGFNI